MPEQNERRLAAPTVPNEDFFSLIQRFQSNRLDEQRSSLPQPSPAPTKAPLQPSSGNAGRGRAGLGFGDVQHNSITSSLFALASQTTQAVKRNSKKLKDKKDKK